MSRLSSVSPLWQAFFGLDRPRPQCPFSGGELEASAARAGVAGRGFAVVASEVKALAEQTAKATGEIGQQITGIQAATQESVNAIKEISGTIEKLSEISSTIAAAVEEQGVPPKSPPGSRDPRAGRVQSGIQ